MTGVLDALAYVAAGVVRAADRRAGPTGSDLSSARPTQDLLASAAAALRADYGDLAAFTDNRPGADPVLDDTPLTELCEVFGLGLRDLAVLAVAVGADLDTNLALAYGALSGSATAGRATVATVLEIIGAPSVSGESFDLLGLDAPLCSGGLVELLGTGPWLTRLVAVPDRVVAHVVGAQWCDPRLRTLLRATVTRDDDAAQAVARALAAGAGLVWVQSPLGATGQASAAGAFATLGLGSVCVEVTRLSAADLPDALRAATLEAALQRAGLVVTGLDVMADPAVDAAACATRLWDAVVPVVGVARGGFDHHWLSRPVLVVRASALRSEERDAAWARAFGTQLEDVSSLAGLRLPPEEIVAVAQAARLRTATWPEPLSAEVVRTAARELGSQREVSSPAAGRARIEDLVLPEHLLADVQRLIAWATHRDDVLGRGAVHGKGGKSAGLAALFTGSPGTGKTLSAHVIAEEIGVELMQVELSSVIDKYIGETEKNLERIFHSAESRNVVLFFDEADALFGSRAEVRDARDRYANQEVSYLLQRMERFDGITLLATNLRGNLDPAFTRRLQFVLHFPDPDCETRSRLWAKHLAQAGSEDPADPVDVALLAGSVELAGGDIRNIVLGATYDAVAEDSALGMRHLRAATQREYTKLGRRAPAAVLVE